MGRYFTQQQKQVAVDKYFECKNSSTVVATLGYPSVNSLLKWAKKIHGGHNQKDIIKFIVMKQS